jgi:hypothetical protein
MLGSRLTALLSVVPEIMKNPEGIFRVFRKPFFCKTISRIFHYGFFGQVARGTFKNRFKARGGARLPARPMHRGDRVAMARPTVHHMPRRAPAPPRGGLPGKHVSWNHCPKSPPGFPGDLVPVFPGVWEIRVFEGGQRRALTESRMLLTYQKRVEAKLNLVNFHSRYHSKILF